MPTLQWAKHVEYLQAPYVCRQAFINVHVGRGIMARSFEVWMVDGCYISYSAHLEFQLSSFYRSDLNPKGSIIAFSVKPQSKTIAALMADLFFIASKHSPHCSSLYVLLTIPPTFTFPESRQSRAAARVCQQRYSSHLKEATYGTCRSQRMSQ